MNQRRVILPAVQNDDLFVSLLPRPVWFLRHYGIFQQSRDLFTASIQTARSIYPLHFVTDEYEFVNKAHDQLRSIDEDKLIQIHEYPTKVGQTMNLGELRQVGQFGFQG